MQSIEKNVETHEGLQKNRDTRRPQSIEKNDGHMKAHRKIYMLAISPNKKLERSYQMEECSSTKNSTHLHCFDLRV